MQFTGRYWTWLVDDDKNAMKRGDVTTRVPTLSEPQRKHVCALIGERTHNVLADEGYFIISAADWVAQVKSHEDSAGRLAKVAEELAKARRDASEISRALSQERDRHDAAGKKVAQYKAAAECWESKYREQCDTSNKFASEIIACRKDLASQLVVLAKLNNLREAARELLVSLPG